MTKIKLCGLSRPCDIQIANELSPEYIGFVFAQKSKRYVPPEKASELKRMLSPEINTVGVFVNEPPGKIAGLLNGNIIDVAQLHGEENEQYILQLRALTDKPVIKAFSINSEKDMLSAQKCSADFVLLDSGNGGTGTVFDWELISNLRKPYFLAGGLDIINVSSAVRKFRPYAVDVSSGIETDGLKDKIKMTAFVKAVRKEDIL